MEPKIVTLGPLCLAGQPYYGNPEGGAFGKAWDRFDTQHKAVNGRVDPKIYYGLQVYGPEFMPEHNWIYMPAVEVKDLSDLPGPLFGKVLPACTYAVFTASHGLASIPDAFMFVYNTWLPGSGYEVAYPFDFELYDDDRFHGDGPNEEIDVYIPIKKKDRMSDRIRALRLHNQQISQPSFPSPAELVAWMGAVQAQDYAGAKWALGLRLAGATDALIEQAFNAGEILRTHVMRPTWHFVTPADIGWLLALTGPRVNATNAYMYRKMELDDALFARSNAALEAALCAGQHLTREELKDVFERAGIPAVTIRLGYLLHRAELDAVVCSGPRQGKQFTYALLALRAPQARRLTREEALGELTRRFFSAHGPATLADYSWWSGLTVADVRQGLRLAGAALRKETIEGREYWLATSAPDLGAPAAEAHLLPAYDEYTIAYKNHDAILDTGYLDLAKSAVYSGTVEYAGELLGNWRRTFQQKRVLVEVAPFRVFSAAEKEAIAQAAQRYANFLEMALEMG